MDALLGLDPGTLKGPEKLDDLEQWDSVALLEFIALTDTHGVQLSPRQIVRCTTVAELLGLAAVAG